MPYSLRDYGDMQADRVRMQAFERALERYVAPGDRVLDIGTGTGILAFLALQQGAGEVWAVEPDDLIQVACEIAEENGLAERIHFVQARVQDVAPGRSFDLVVSDLHGVMPQHGDHLPAIQDASRRLLRPGGTLLPSQDDLVAAVVHLPRVHGALVGPWDENPWGLRMAPGRRRVLGGMHKVRLAADDLLTEASVWARLRYGPDVAERYSGEIAWTMGRDAEAHGIGLWFDAWLGPDIRISNAPTEPPAIYGQSYLAWPRAVSLRRGDRIELRISADPVDGDYVWRWRTRVRAGSAEGASASFDQSTLDGLGMPPARLARLREDHRPHLGEEARLDALVLGLLDGRRSVGEAADALMRDAPERFPSRRYAMARVSEVAERYEDTKRRSLRSSRSSMPRSSSSSGR